MRSTGRRDRNWFDCAKSGRKLWTGRFDGHLLDLSDYRRLGDFVKKLLDQSHRARIVSLRLRALPTRSTEEHRRILECLAATDAERTHSVFRLHRQRAAKEKLDLLERCALARF